MSTPRKILLILAVALGASMFVYGGWDDSPGGQMLGLLMVVIGVVGLARRKRRGL